MFLTPENLEKLRPQAQGLQISLTHFLEPTDSALLQATAGKAPGRGALGHPLAGLPPWPVVATNRDSLLQEFSPPVGGRASNGTACYMATHSGGQLVTPARYMEAVQALRPDILVTMADEVPAAAPRRRAAASVDRTAEWLEECLALLPGARWGHQKAPTDQQQQQQQQAQASSNAASGPGDAEQPAKRQRYQCDAADGSGGAGDLGAAPLVLAPVMGGSHPSERARAAQAVAAAPVAGFALCGFGMGEDPASHAQLLAAALEHLPTRKPRLLQGMMSPSEVLQGVMQGVDLFDCGYPMRATLDGVALCFPWAGPPGGGGGGGGGGGEGAGAEGTSLEDGEDGIMNLRLLKYRADARPIAAGCGCFTCRTHSRAYLHHLLDVNELLASVLLESHNTHWWLGFFAAIRAAIEGGRLEGYAAWFRGHRRGAAAGGAVAAQ